jgi:hypothetical protein
MWRTEVAFGLVTLVAASFGACAGTTGDANSAGSAGNEKRETAIEHEPCDLGSSSTKPLDADLDGRPEILRVMDGSRELCRAIDLNRDGTIERFVYFDEQGRERRMESGFDTDNQPDEVTHLEAGVVVRKERQTNHTGNIDTWDYFQAGKLVRSERDSNADGIIDQWWTFGGGSQGCPEVVADVDGDGKADPSSRMSMCDEKAGASAASKGAADAGAPQRAADAGLGSAAGEVAAPAPPTETPSAGGSEEGGE